MTTFEFHLYDAFTERPFTGNPAAVVFGADGLSPADRQRIASEFPVPTTAFVASGNGGRFAVRLFTPETEIPMCVHAHVAAFAALAEGGRLGPPARAPVELEVETRVGRLPVTVRRALDAPTSVMVTLPVPEFRPPGVEAERLALLLGAEPERLDPEAPMEIAAAALHHLIVPFRSRADLEALRPDFPGLAALSRDLGVHTLAAVSRDPVEARNDYHLRDFSPAIGNPEEAASGTTNAAVACWLVRHGLAGTADPPAEWTAFQGEQGYEMGRPSLVRSQLRVEGGTVTGARVGGPAVHVLAGRLELPLPISSRSGSTRRPRSSPDRPRRR